MKHHILRNKLAKKKWHENDINHALNAFSAAKEKRKPILHFLDRSFSWFTLLIIIIINFIVLFSMIPVYLIMPFYVVIGCLVLVGLCFGFLIDLVIKDIEYFTHHHYIIAGIVLPVLSIVTLYYTLKFIAPISALFNVTQNYNIALLVIIYLLSYVFPHVIYKIIEIKERKDYESS